MSRIVSAFSFRVATDALALDTTSLASEILAKQRGKNVRCALELSAQRKKAQAMFSRIWRSDGGLGKATGQLEGTIQMRGGLEWRQSLLWKENVVSLKAGRSCQACYATCVPILTTHFSMHF